MLAKKTDINRIIKETLRERGVDFIDQEFIINLFDATLATFNLGARLDVERLDAIAEELAGKLFDTQHLLLQLRQQTEELKTLRNLSKRLSANLDLRAILHAVVNDAMQLQDKPRTAHIFLYNEETDKIAFGAARDENGLRKDSFADPRPNGLTYQVARKREWIIIPDMTKHPIYKDSPTDWTGSIVGIPLEFDGHIVGVMSISRADTGEFSESNLRLLELLAEQAAIAISNAHLHALVSQEANRDTMTGLPNRRALDAKLESEIELAHHSGYSFAVVMMDLDGFKMVNDGYGHPVGDQVLRTLFNYLHIGVRSNDFLARYGGDELTLVLPKSDQSIARVVTDKLLNRLNEYNFKLPDGKVAELGMSGGIAIYPLHGRSPTELLRAADQALYHAKKYKRGTFEMARPLTIPR
jgi:diguanylate cyclase (GGDEF)-like protein